MKLKIWLDDIRTPPDDSWIWVKRYDQFCELLYTEIDEVSFDHDIGLWRHTRNGKPAINEWEMLHKSLYPNHYTEHGEHEYPKTGYDCAKALVRAHMDGRITKIPKWHVHSANPVGAENIRSLLNNYEKSITCTCNQFTTNAFAECPVHDHPKENCDRIQN